MDDLTQTLGFEVRESQIYIQALETKVKGLQDDKKILEQGLTATKNSLEEQLKHLQESHTQLLSEKQHFNERLRDKDTAMEDLSDKFVAVTDEKGELEQRLQAQEAESERKYDRLKNELERVRAANRGGHAPANDQVLQKKFQEVEELHQELFEAKQEVKALSTHNKQAERILMNQKKIIETLQKSCDDFRDERKALLDETNRLKRSLQEASKTIQCLQTALREPHPIPLQPTPFSPHLTSHNGLPNSIPHSPQYVAAPIRQTQSVHHYPVEQPAQPFGNSASEMYVNLPSNLTSGTGGEPIVNPPPEGQPLPVHDQFYHNLGDLLLRDQLDSHFQNLPLNECAQHAGHW